jgi:hypothetical protein
MSQPHREWSQRDIKIFRSALKRGASIGETARLLLRDERDIWTKGAELGFLMPRKETPVYPGSRDEQPPRPRGRGTPAKEQPS